MFIGAQSLIFSDNKKRLLLIKRSDFPVWTLPGGRKERRESLKKTAIRETLEETGLRVKIIKFVGKYKVWYLPLAGVTSVFVCRRISGSLKRNREVSQLKFWPIKCLPINLLPYLRKRIRDGLEVVQHKKIS